MTREFKEMLTGWGIVGQTHEMTALAGEIRANEERLRRGWQGLAPGEAAGLLWQMVSEGVCEARAWGGEGVALGDLCERALGLRGEPKEVFGRRLMRERARVLLHVLSPRDRHDPPKAPADLLRMWDEATRLEPEVRLRVDAPRWRVAEDGLPFTGMGTLWLFDEPLPLRPGGETASPDDIPALVEELLGFIGENGFEPEVAAAHAPHLLFYIHPFVDGNGHLSRMLLCDLLMLAGYGAPTLVSYVDCYHMHREELSALVRSVLLGEADPGELVALQLRFLLEAQEAAAGN